MATPSVRTSPSRPAPFAAAKRRPVLLRCAVRRPYWSAGRRSASNAPPRRTSPRSPCAPEATTTTTTSKTGGCARRPSTSPSAGAIYRTAADSIMPTCGPPTSARCRRRRRRRRRRPRRRRSLPLPPPPPPAPEGCIRLADVDIVGVDATTDETLYQSRIPQLEIEWPSLGRPLYSTAELTAGGYVDVFAPGDLASLTMTISYSHSPPPPPLPPGSTCGDYPDYCDCHINPDYCAERLIDRRITVYPECRGGFSALTNCRDPGEPLGRWCLPMPTCADGACRRNVCR